MRNCLFTMIFGKAYLFEELQNQNESNVLYIDDYEKKF